MITVKIAKLGSRVVEVALTEGASATEALQIAELDPQGFELRVNGTMITVPVVLNDGDVITLVPAIKGG